MHNVPGLWNGIWGDMLIEKTFMRYGHGPGGIIGITLKPETLKTWALGLHICSRLEQDITNCRRSKLPCTLFCKSNAGDECLNELTKTVAIPREVTD